MDGWLRNFGAAATGAFLLGSAAYASQDAAMQASPESIAQVLRTRYEDTRGDCGGPALPAFLCSGVLLRGTKASTAYHSWDPSPNAEKTGAVSFSFLRKDAEFNAFALGYQNGFIFEPYLSTQGKVKPAVLCSFPVDASTYRRDERGCGAYDTYPAKSAPCQKQGIRKAEGWRSSFTRVAGANGKFTQCGFDVTGEDSASAFLESVKAMKYAPSFQGANPENELRIETWKAGIPADLPIEAFFYSGDGLAGAQHDQRDYFRETGIVLPIVRIALPSSPAADAVFVFRSQDQAVGVPAAVAQDVPTISEASGDSGSKLLIADFYRADHLTVVVPAYEGMAAGQSVTVTWVGPSHTYVAPPANVAAVSPLRVPVPRAEVIDAIGSTVRIVFTARTSDGDVLISRTSTVDVEAQPLELPAPSLSRDHTQVLVRFPAMDVGYHANVRLEGATTLDLPRTDLVSKDVLALRIPDAWLAANRGRDILVTYAVAAKAERDRWQFSRVLRVRL